MNKNLKQIIDTNFSDIHFNHNESKSNEIILIKKFNFKAAAILIVLTLFIGAATIYIMPTTYNLNSFDLNNEYKQTLNISETKDNITITLKYVIYDANTLVLNYDISNTQKFEGLISVFNSIDFLNPNIQISNGIRNSMRGVGERYKINDNLYNMTTRWYFNSPILDKYNQLYLVFKAKNYLNLQDTSDQAVNPAISLDISIPFTAYKKFNNEIEIKKVNYIIDDLIEINEIMYIKSPLKNEIIIWGKHDAEVGYSIKYDKSSLDFIIQNLNGELITINRGYYSGSQYSPSSDMEFVYRYTIEEIKSLDDIKIIPRKNLNEDKYYNNKVSISYKLDELPKQIIQGETIIDILDVYTEQDEYIIKYKKSGDYISEKSCYFEIKNEGEETFLTEKYYIEDGINYCRFKNDGKQKIIKISDYTNSNYQYLDEIKYND